MEMLKLHGIRTNLAAVAHEYGQVTGWMCPCGWSVDVGRCVADLGREKAPLRFHVAHCPQAVAVGQVQQRIREDAADLRREPTCDFAKGKAAGLLAALDRMGIN